MPKNDKSEVTEAPAPTLMELLAHHELLNQNIAEAERQVEIQAARDLLAAVDVADAKKTKAKTAAVPKAPASSAPNPFAQTGETGEASEPPEAP